METVNLKEAFRALLSQKTLKASNKYRILKKTLASDTEKSKRTFGWPGGGSAKLFRDTESLQKVSLNKPWSY